MTAQVEEPQGDRMGVFYIDDDFLENFSYSPTQNKTNPRIDMEKLDFRETTKDYHFFKKKFPLFDDDIIEMLVELEIQQDRKQKVVDTVKQVIDSQNNNLKPPRKKNPDKLKITNKPCVVSFD
jgi:DNA-binding transcriptional regulator GbsR (MarR family)